MDLEQQLGIKFAVLVAGFIGGIVSLTYETKISAKRALLLIVSGASTAAYLHPIAEGILGFPEKFSSGLGFILGLVSMKLIDFLLKNTQKYLKSKLITTANGHNSDDEPTGPDQPVLGRD